MVALVDDLQAKDLVRRRREPDDRRKNILELTRQGRELNERGGRLIEECEQAFLAHLSKAEAVQLKKALAAVIAGKA